MFYVFFPPGVYDWTLNSIASIPGPFILTLLRLFYYVLEAVHKLSFLNIRVL